MALKVIGAGLGRTGTLSLKLALEMLGFGPCYHMTELLADPSRVVLWRPAWRGEPTDWDAVFAGYASTVDYPACRHYAELARVYPEAKVVLTVRDPERWWQSCMETIHKGPRLGPKLALVTKALVSRRHRQLISIFRHGPRLMWQEDFEGRFAEREFAIAKFNAHVAEVRATIPAERLLVMEVGEGWDRLCEFLDVPVPEVPYPRSNDRKAFAQRLAKGIDRIVPERAEPLASPARP